MEDDLDAEIRALHNRILDLKSQRTNLSTILLSSPHLQTRLRQTSRKSSTKSTKALQLVEKQTQRNIENTHRSCAGITAYKIKDPDPNAIDNGNVLGVQIEVSVKGRFLEPYQIFLVRPDSRKGFETVLKIHKHTIPPCIPLAPLAAKWLPLPSPKSSIPPNQDVPRLMRALRRELASYELRKAAVTELRKDAGLDGENPRRRPDKDETEEDSGLAIGKIFNAVPDKRGEDEDSYGASDDEEEAERRRKNAPQTILDITANAAFREITIEWSDGQAAKVALTKDGEVEKGVVRTSDGIRVSELERRMSGRIEGLLERLTEGAEALRTHALFEE